MRTFATALVTLLLVALPVAAGELAGVTLPDTKSVAGQDLVLNGMAVRKKFFVKVYVAGLYLPAEETSAPAVLAADGPRHMVMEFVHKAGKEKICDAWYEGLEANVENPSGELRGQFDTLCEWMPEVEVGDTFHFTYLPGEGTEVKVNGEVEGSIAGKEFADALFASWIGPKPGPGEGFKKDLMGG